MHTEHNVWLNTLDIMHHEAVQREIIEVFKVTLSSSQTKQTSSKNTLQENIANSDAAGDNLTSVDKLQNTQDTEAEKSQQCGVSHYSREIVNVDCSTGLVRCLEKIKNKNKSKLHKESKLGVGLPAVAKKIAEHFDKESTRHHKLNSSCRLIGEQAISLARYSFRLVDALKKEGEASAQKCKRLVIGRLCQLLRDMGSIFNEIETNQAELTLLRELGQQFYNLHVLFLGRESLTNSVWTVSHAIPYFAQELYDTYKIGFGILSMQGKESNNAGTKEALAHSNRSSAEEGPNKWRQVFVSEYVRSFYIPELEPHPDKYKPHFISRIPDFCAANDHCECGREYSENEVNFCTICDDEFMTYVNDSAAQGKIHEGLIEIFQPYACSTCEKRYITAALLDEHCKMHVSQSFAEPDEEDEPIDFSALSVKQLKVELAKRNIKCPRKHQKMDLVTLLEQHDACC